MPKQKDSVESILYRSSSIFHCMRGIYNLVDVFGSFACELFEVIQLI